MLCRTRFSTGPMSSQDHLSLAGLLCCFGSDPRADPQSTQPSLAVRGLGHGPAPASASASGPQRRSRSWRACRCWGYRWKKRGRSFLQRCQRADLPGPVQGLVILQQVRTLQESCQHQFGGCRWKGLDEQGLFCVLVLCEPVTMHLRSISHQRASIPGDVEVQVVPCQDQLGVRCLSIWVWRQDHAEGLQELCGAEELKPHD